MEGIQEEYLAYLQQAESLPNEMRKRGIQFVNPKFIKTNFVVYVDGTAEVPIRNQPLLSRIGLRKKVTERMGLESVGELLHHLTSTENRYQSIPGNLDQISYSDLKCLSSALHLAEEFSVIKSTRLLEKQVEIIQGL